MKFGTALVISSDDDLRLNLVRVLSRNGWNVKAQTSFFSEHLVDPTASFPAKLLADVLVLHYTTSKVEALDLLMDLHRDHPELPIIILASRNEGEKPIVSREVVLGLGAKDFFLLPLTFDDLLTALEASVSAVVA